MTVSIRIQLDGPLEFAAGAFPVPLKKQLMNAERDMGLGQTFVQFDRFLGGLLCLYPRVASGQWSVNSDNVVSTGDACVCQSVIRIFFKCGLVIVDAGEQILGIEGSPVLAALEVKLISLGRVGVSFAQPSSL